MKLRKLRLAHPGKILREEFMQPVGLSAYALAKSLDVPLPRVTATGSICRLTTISKWPRIA